MSTCLLNQFPIELLYDIFGYLQAFEIVRSFSDVNDHLHRVVANYNRYSLNFRGILKTHFDHLCQLIQPWQVISLTLSDDDETPDQCEVFFSRFNIEQFVNLRAFEMVSTSKDAFRHLTNLGHLERLTSLILPVFHPMATCNDIKKPFPQLHRLETNTSEIIDRLPQLYHLTVTKYERPPLSYLSNDNMPNLRSLDITLSLSSILALDWSSPALFWSQLRRLLIKTTDNEIVSSMSQLLPKLIHLQHLEIEQQHAADIPTGERWEPLVSHLKIFDFRITVNHGPSNASQRQILESFVSPFWLKQKRWFVAYKSNVFEQILFTVPRFVLTEVLDLRHYQPTCTLPTFNFDRHIRRIKLTGTLPSPSRFPHLTSLKFRGGGSNCPINSTLSIAALLRELPQVHSLSFVGDWSSSIIPNDDVFEQIRSFQVRHTFDECRNRSLYDARQLRSIFPRLERLSMSIHGPQEMLYLIDELEQLSISSFEWFHPVSTVELFQSWPRELTRDWLVNHSRRLKRNANFTCAFQGRDTHLWIGEEQQTSTTNLFQRGASLCCIQ